MKTDGSNDINGSYSRAPIGVNYVKTRSYVYFKLNFIILKSLWATEHKTHKTASELTCKIKIKQIREIKSPMEGLAITEVMIKRRS